MSLDKLLKSGKSTTLFNVLNPNISLPDWESYSHMGVVDIKEAVYLSMNFDPEMPFIESLMNLSALEEFNKRLKVANSRRDIVRDGMVELREFANFARQLGWEVSKDFFNEKEKIKKRPLWKDVLEPHALKMLKDLEGLPINQTDFTRNCWRYLRDYQTNTDSQLKIPKQETIRTELLDATWWKKHRK